MSQCLGLTARVPDIPQTQILDDTVGIEQYSENKTYVVVYMRTPPKLSQNQKSGLKAF